MNFFSVFFKSCLRTRLARTRTWLMLFLLPIMGFGALRLLPPEEVSAPVQVGVVLPEEGGGALWARLEERDGLVVSFHRADRTQAERQVAAGRWDCALILPYDVEERLARQDLEELFTLLIGPGSAVYPMVRETVSACVAELVSPAIGENYLLDSGILGEKELPQARSRLQEVLLEPDRVLVSMRTLDGRPLDPIALADNGSARLVSGLTAILLLIWALLTAMDLGRWLDSPFARRLVPLRGALPLLLPRLGAALLPALCAGTMTLLAAGGTAPQALALVPYLLFWGGAALALAQCRPLWSALPALLPFVPVLSLLLSPVLVDLSLLFPALGPVVRWTPTALFLRAWGGSWGDGLILIGGGMAILALLAALDRKKA